MSLMDDARRLADTDPDVADICFACGNDSAKHYDDCAWLVMPRIVAALEVAERHGLLDRAPYTCDGCGKVCDGWDRERKPRRGAHAFCPGCRAGDLASKRLSARARRSLSTQVVP